jgi:cytochrome P450 family 110
MKQPPALHTPPFLNLMQWIIRPLDLLEDGAKQYGDCFSVRFSKLPPLNFFSHPQAIEKIFTANASQFDSGRGNWILRTTVGDNSLLLLDGERHQRQRQLLMPPFHGERMRTYGHLIGQITERVISNWQVGQPFVVRPYTQEISLRVILRAVFGLDEGERYEAIKQRLEALLRVTASRFGFATSFFPVLQRDLGAWSPGGRFIRFKQQIDQLLYAEIQDRRNHPDPNRSDILSLLLAARDESGQPMTDEELRDELITLLLAGHETTATAIAWALYWIHQIPEIRTKLLAELETLGNGFEPMAIARLPYLNAVCAETLRIYPVGFITEIRITKVPIEVMGYAFEPENYLVPCIYLTHHREDLYPEPKRFKPERFLQRQFSPFEYFPFGGSNRRCIGAAFALFEMKLVLATILSRYQLALADSRPVVPIRRGVTIAPKGGVNLVVTERYPSQPSSQPFPVSV